MSSLENLIVNVGESVQSSPQSYLIYIVLSIFLSTLISFFFRPWLRVLLKKILKPIFPERSMHLVMKLLAPMQFFLGLAIFSIFYLFLIDHRNIKEVFKFGLSLSFLVAATILVYKVLDILFDKALLEHEHTPSKIGPLLPLLRRVAKSVLLVTAFLFLLAQLNVDVSALLVGLGVSSLAIALAAQKILENLFGGAMLSLDQPFKVGDEIKSGEYTGVVLEIGLRSTRMRTRERTIVTVPNGVLSQATIENFSDREKIRLYQKLFLSLETNSQALSSALKKIREIITTSPELHHDLFRVRLIDVDEYGYTVEVMAYAQTTESHESIAIKEALLLKITSFLEEAGIKLSVPERGRY